MKFLMILMSFLFVNQALAQKSIVIPLTARGGADTYMGPKASIGLGLGEHNKQLFSDSEMIAHFIYEGSKDTDALSFRISGDGSNPSMTVRLPEVRYTMYRNRETKKKGNSISIDVCPVPLIYIPVGYQNKPGQSGLFIGLEIGI